MDVGDQGHVAALAAEFGDDVLQVRRVLDSGRGDAHELAADGDEFQRLLDTQRGVHGVAGEHGLLHHGVRSAHDEAAAGGVADDDFAGQASLIHEGGWAVAHGGINFAAQK